MRPWITATLLLPFLVAVASSCAACSHGVREAALHSYALDLCKTMNHKGGDTCNAEVEANFSRCSEPFLDQKTTSEAFAECLGFVMPPPAVAPRVIAECSAPRFRAKLALSAARPSEWPTATRREVNGQVLFASSVATITENDVQAARLEDADVGRLLMVELAPDAAKRLERDTGSNIGNFLVLSLNGTEIAMKIRSAIPGPKVSIGAEGIQPQDVCEP